jgi:hypothetical protein
MLIFPSLIQVLNIGSQILLLILPGWVEEFSQNVIDDKSHTTTTECILSS